MAFQTGGTMTHEPEIQCAAHLSTALTPQKLRKAVAATIKFLKGKDFDAIAFRGLSGQLFAPIIAIRLRKTLLAVRKGEDTHSTQMVEGDLGARNYIIIDDFIAGGNTVNQIIKEIYAVRPSIKCVGYFGYNRAWEDITIAGWREPKEIAQYVHGGRHEDALRNHPILAPEKETMLTVDSLLPTWTTEPARWNFRYSVGYPMGEQIAKPEEGVSGVESPQLETPSATD
jgi:hypothetical protein